MDQIKIGALLRDLRKEHNLTQEEIAAKFGVSQRSVSRWENGNTMPDISILIELADFYNVDLREILNGERKAENMDADMKETLVMVADYTREEKKKLAKSLIAKICVCAVAFIVLGIIILFDLGGSGWWRRTAEFCFIIGATYEVCNLFEFLQLTGKISKKSEGKVIAVIIVIFIAMNLALAVADHFI